jgi:hypothetical protein
MRTSSDPSQSADSPLACDGDSGAAALVFAGERPKVVGIFQQSTSRSADDSCTGADGSQLFIKTESFALWALQAMARPPAI